MKTILYTYKEYLKSNNKLHFNSYENLHNWSINEISDFWKSIVDFFDIEFDKPPTSIYKFNNAYYKMLIKVVFATIIMALYIFYFLNFMVTNNLKCFNLLP